MGDIWEQMKIASGTKNKQWQPPFWTNKSGCWKEKNKETERPGGQARPVNVRQTLKRGSQKEKKKYGRPSLFGLIITNLATRIPGPFDVLKVDTLSIPPYSSNSRRQWGWGWGPGEVCASLVYWAAPGRSLMEARCDVFTCPGVELRVDLLCGR